MVGETVKKREEEEEGSRGRGRKPRGENLQRLCGQERPRAADALFQAA